MALLMLGRLSSELLWLRLTVLRELGALFFGRSLVQIARDDGYPALSLSVSPLNHARLLYASEGFRKVGESGTSWTLLLRLDQGAS
jgi:hypothetical protein